MIIRQCGNVLALVILMASLGACVKEPVGNSPIAQPPGRSTTVVAQPVPTSQEALAADPAWFSCRKDADCTQLPTPCGGVQGVNTRSATQYAVYSQRLARTLNCVQNPKASTVKSKAVCVKTRCNVVQASEQ